MNCLTCHYPRTNSLRGEFEAAINKDAERSRYGLDLMRQQVNRSWSGNLVPRPNGAAGNKSRSTDAASIVGPHRGAGVPLRRHSGPVECETPRLVRSSGMRRDWSFEDLENFFEHQLQNIPFEPHRSFNRKGITVVTPTKLVRLLTDVRGDFKVTCSGVVYWPGLPSLWSFAG